MLRKMSDGRYGKKIAAMILTVLVMSLCGAAMAEEIVYYAMGGEELLYAAGEQGIWYYDSGKFLFQDPADGRAKDMYEAENVTQIAAGETTLFFTTETDGGTEVSILGPEGFLYQENTKLQIESEVVQIESACDQLFALLSDGKIYRVDAYTGTAEEMAISGWENERISAFSGYGEYLVTYSAESGVLALLDVPGNTQIASVPVRNDFSFVQYGYETDDAEYAVAVTGDPAEMWRIRLTDGETEQVEASLPKKVSGGLRRSERVFYTLNGKGKQVYAIPLSDVSGQAAKGTLTIVDAFFEADWMDAVEDRFHEQYPDIDIVYRSIYDYRVIATEMMSEEGDIDILCVQENAMGACSAQMLRSGAIVEIGERPEIQEHLSAYKDIWNIVSADGHMYAIPVMMEEYLWQVDESLAEKIGWTAPEMEWTWDEFQALAEQVAAYNETAEEHVYLLRNGYTPYIFLQYQANHVDPYLGTADYETDEFIKLLNIWKYLYDHDLLIYDWEWNFKETRPILLDGGEDYHQAYQLLRSGTYILPPVTDENTVYPVEVYTLCVSANSELVDEAVYFLACMLDPQTVLDRKHNGGIDCESGMILKDESVYGDTWKATPENDVRWTYSLLHGAPTYYLYDILRTQENEYLPKLFAGEVSAEEYVAVSQRLAEMALGE